MVKETATEVLCLWTKECQGLLANHQKPERNLTHRLQMEHVPTKNLFPTSKPP